MKYLLTGFGLILIALLQCGCGSLASLRGSPFGFDDEPQYVRHGYGGVKNDWVQFTHSQDQGVRGFWILGVPFLFDLPLSLAVDTVALPFTIPYSLLRQEDGTSTAAVSGAKSQSWKRRDGDYIGMPAP